MIQPPAYSPLCNTNTALYKLYVSQYSEYLKVFEAIKDYHESICNDRRLLHDEMRGVIENSVSAGNSQQLFGRGSGGNIEQFSEPSVDTMDSFDRSTDRCTSDDLGNNVRQVSAEKRTTNSEQSVSTTQCVVLTPRGPNYERNKKARERRKANKLTAKRVAEKESQPIDELRETWNQRRILENKKRAAIDKAFLDNLETDPEYFARSYRKYQAVNDASQTKAFYETTKAEVHLNTVNMYHKAVEAGYAKTVVSSLLSGSKAADSLSPHDSISAAEGVAELHTIKKEKQILEKKLADADHRARTVQAELDALKKDLVKPRSLEEWAKIDARRASEYRKATNRRLH
jgi:hypothetical protein